MGNTCAFILDPFLFQKIVNKLLIKYYICGHFSKISDYEENIIITIIFNIKFC